MNGIPWWYFYKSGSEFEGRHLTSVDPGGRQWNTIGPERAIGCVVEPACEVAEPGVIVHHEFNRFVLGEPDGSRSKRLAGLSETLIAAGFDAPIRDNIRWNIWLKMWGNVMSMLQDVERGRTMEIDALVTVVQELGRLTGAATPVVDAVLALVQERGRTLGLYRPLAGGAVA